MKSRYQIVQIKPEGYIHADCFDEIAYLLDSSFKTLGLDCDISVNKFYEDKINIILGFHLLKIQHIPKNVKYIPYQLEQLSAKEGWYSDNMKEILAGAAEIWDYSEENIEFLSNLGLHAKHLQVGYQKKLEKIANLPYAQKDIDVLFYGSINQRRQDILSEIKDLNLKALFGKYGQERDDYISRAKIILNIHFYSKQIMEIVRVSYLLNNKCFVITENSEINPYKSIGLVSPEYDQIIRKIRYFLNNHQEIDEIRMKNYDRFKSQFPMETLLEKII